MRYVALLFTRLPVSVKKPYYFCQAFEFFLACPVLKCLERTFKILKEIQTYKEVARAVKGIPLYPDSPVLTVSRIPYPHSLHPSAPPGLP